MHYQHGFNFERDTSPDLGPLEPVLLSQGRIMGGGSSVMGMVALRGTPDDYAELLESEED